MHRSDQEPARDLEQWLGLLLAVGLAAVTWRAPTLPVTPSLALLGALGLRGGWRLGLSWRETGVVLALLMVFAGLTSVAHLMDRPDGGEALYLAALDVRVVAAAWAVVLWIPRRFRGAPLELPPWSVLAGAGVAVAAVAIAAIRLLPAGTTGFTDEVLYLFQSTLMAHGQPHAPLPLEWRPFFAIVNTVTGDGTIHSQYPPGWPALLAGLRLVGLDAVAPAAVGVLLMAGIAGAASLYAGRSGAVLALIAAALCYPLVRWSSGYLAHGATAAVLVAMLIALVWAARTGRAPWAALAGLLGGLAVTMRPLTGVCLGLAVVLWVAGTESGFRQRPLRYLLALALGGLLPAAGFLGYNLWTNGHPFTLGYTEAHGGSHAPGLGQQVRWRYGVDGVRFSDVMTFPPLDPFRKLAEHLSITALVALPGGLAVPVVWRAMREGFRIPVAATAFLLLPAGFLFWSTTTYRAMSEALPFAAIGLGVALASLRRRDARAAGLILASVLVAAALLLPTRLAPDERQARRWLPHIEAVEAAAAAGPILVFVNRGDDPVDVVFEKLWLYNARDWMGAVIVARDLGARNAELLAAWPTHRPFRLTVRRDQPGGFSLVPACQADDCGP